MALNDIAPHGPFTCEVKFHVTNGENDAEISFDAPVGTAPSEAGLAILAEKALAAIRDAAPGAWRFQTRDEFVERQIRELAGAPASVRFATPEGEFSMEWAK